MLEFIHSSDLSTDGLRAVKGTIKSTDFFKELFLAAGFLIGFLEL